MKLSLVVLTPGKQEGKALEIKLPQFLIGRDPDCHLRPASPLISKRHCAILLKDGKAFLRDFESTNGCSVNDQPVKGEVELKHDDQVKIGPLHFRVRLEESAPAREAAPSDPEAKTVALQAEKTMTVGSKEIPASKSGPVKKIASPAAPPAKSDAPARAPAAKSDAPASAKAPAAKTPAAKPETPAKAPPPKKPMVPSPSDGEDDIAALLLSLDDDNESGGGLASNVQIPEGATELDMRALSPTETDPSAAKDAEKKDEKKPDHKGNTASAAKAILEQMMRRPRS